MQTRAQRQSRFPVALAAVLLIVAIAILLYRSGSPSLLAGHAVPEPTIPAPPATATAQPQAAQPTTAAPNPSATAQADDPALADAIDELIGGREGIYGIVIASPTLGTRYSENADVPFLAASLYKLVLIADVYAGIEAGLVDPNLEIELLPEYFPGEGEPEDSYYTADFIGATALLDELLFATGAYSSNVAAHALLSLTDDSDLEETARSLGMTGTHFHIEPPEMADWPPTGLADTEPATLEQAVDFAEAQAANGPIMLTTPRDMATYFTKLLDGEVINAGVSDRILETLKSQAVDDRFPCLLPLGTEMAHKTGNIDHVVHDVGIIWGADGPVILVAMIEDSEDDADATLIIQRLALFAYGAEEAPSVEDGYASPETTCGIVAPLEEAIPADDEFTEEEGA